LHQRAVALLPQSRFELVVVERNGGTGVRKDFRGNRIAFVNEVWPCYAIVSARAFSSEVDTGSRQENASKHKSLEPRSDSIGTEKAPGVSS